MEFLYNYNSLPFYNEQELLYMEYITKSLALDIKNILVNQNKAWQFVQIEAPTLIPREYISDNYTDDDIWVQQKKDSHSLVLKPETTPSSYLYLEHLMINKAQQLPICVWQTSKSYRREQDQPTKHCRFKEFHHLEFQCLYSSNTKNDYQENTIKEIAESFMRLTALPTRIVIADRLPSYSLKTIDIEVWNADKWMEVCSVSLRNDFKYQPSINNKPIPCLVLEIATSLDRIIYNSSQRSSVYHNLSVSDSR